MFIKRFVLKELEAHLSKPEITVLVGPRQAGKTTLLLKLKEKLEKKRLPHLFLTLDRETHRKLLTSQEGFLKRLKIEFGEKKAYVFIDEIQRKKNAGIFLKGLYDSNLPYKFIVSGSGSLDIKGDIKESLAGRKQLFFLPPLSFKEFLNFKTEYRFENNLREFLSIEKDQAEELLKEYLSFGGYPKVVLAENFEEKLKAIDEIYQSFIEKDILNLINVEKSQEFSDLIKILASQVGQPVNYSEISSLLNLSLQTVKKYLWYLEKSFIVKKVTPFFRNVRKEIRKSPVYYFWDIGFKNYALEEFAFPPKNGFNFQNLVFLLLIEKTRYTAQTIHFWRSKNKAEVDFVIKKGLEPVPYEVKFKSYTKSSLPRSLSSFISTYQPKQAYLINLAPEKRTIEKNESKIKILPYWELL